VHHEIAILLYLVSRAVRVLAGTGQIEYNSRMHIAPLTPADVTADLLVDFHRLLPQLSADPLPSFDQLAEIVSVPTTHVLVVRVPDANGAIVGTLTLAGYRTPTGLHVWIEDVVVDAAHRGHGIGEALCRAAVELAAAQGANSVNLTSRPSRLAANQLYAKLGFVRRETNVYRLDVSAA